MLASVLILLERSGKAVRSPSKSALLAHVASAVGRGRGFGVHKALDQVGAFAGPLLVAGVIAATGAIWPSMAVLAIPGAAAMLLLAVIRSRVPDPSVYDVETRTSRRAARAAVGSGWWPARRGLRGWFADAVGSGLPREFFGYALAAGLMTGGLVTFGIIGYHLTVEGLVPVATVPVVYAGAMAVEALAALGVGLVYDRRGGAVLYAVPVLVALVPPLALSGSVCALARRGRRLGPGLRRAGLDRQGARRGGRGGTEARDGIRRLRGGAGRVRDRRRARGRLALRPVAARRSSSSWR